MGFFTLVRTNTLMQLRNRSSLFWHFAFPLIFIILFGLIFGKGGGRVDIGLTSKNPRVTKAFKAAFAKSKDVKLIKGSIKSLTDKLKKGDLDIVIAVGEQEKYKPTDVEIYYDPAETFTSEVGKSLVSSVLDEITKQTFKVPKLFEIKKRSVATKTLSYISFLLPGVLGMSIMFSAMFGTAYPLVNEREKGILRRLRMTLMSPVTFIAAKSVGMVIIAFIQAAIIVATGILIFDVKIIGSYIDASFIVLLGCLMMVALGLFIAGLANRIESLDAIANAIAMPMMFLAGTFFPIDNAPHWLRTLANFLPLTYLNEALRDIMVRGKSLFDINADILIIFAWTVGFLVLAIYFFKWELPQKSRS